jgi:dTDP-4-dehydrorhamnose reductase
MTSGSRSAPLELWGGIECTVNRVGDRWFDQLARSGHDARSDDLARFATLGIRTLRYPILWERTAPHTPTQIDWRWSDTRLAEMHDLGLRPIVGLLHHGSGPAYTSLLDPRFPVRFARFARAVAERYPWVTDFTPVNEPLTTARFSGLYGHWYPHARSTREYVRALMTQMRGVVLAMRAIREVIPHARLVQTEDCGEAFGTPVTEPQVAHECDRRWLTWDLLTGRVDSRHPLWPFLRTSGVTPRELAFFRDPPCPPDMLGLNYYLTSDRHLDERLESYPPWSHGGNGMLRYADIEAVRARPAGIVGHCGHLVAAWERYRIPTAITEVHLACTREEQMRWLVESWHGAQQARAAGADVRAVTAWALLGSYDWNSLVTRESGHYEPGVYDVRGPVPRPTALAGVVQALTAGREPSHPALDGPAWWTRPERLLYSGRSSTAATESRGAPVLIVGATGTLGRAFHRICAHRGLASVLASRIDMDITDSASVEAVVRKVEPWAIVNAAGYVRVDDAERDIEACRRANVAGPINLAATCRRRGLPLVTFSSDLVFDGTAGRPYVEDDRPNPLNVYGATKAEAERRVRELLPDALVIRTSAFFGPWDSYNFLSCLFRALDDGVAFDAAADSTVSPTYVPDLVHATLDLLIDGESGIWHVANQGALTWFDFGRQAAAVSNRPVDLVRPTATTQVWGPARRPPFSALTSARGVMLPTLDQAIAAYSRESRAMTPAA